MVVEYLSIPLKWNILMYIYRNHFFNLSMTPLLNVILTLGMTSDSNFWPRNKVYRTPGDKQVISWIWHPIGKKTSFWFCLFFFPQKKNLTKSFLFPPFSIFLCDFFMIVQLEHDGNHFFYLFLLLLHLRERYIFFVAMALLQMRYLKPHELLYVAR